jgi:hypothetical protein
MKTLNDSQRKFLEYLRDSHKSLGWGDTIRTMLTHGRYNPSSIIAIIASFNKLKSGNDKYREGLFGIPTKYLK